MQLTLYSISVQERKPGPGNKEQNWCCASVTPALGPEEGREVGGSCLSVCPVETASSKCQVQREPLLHMVSQRYTRGGRSDVSLRPAHMPTRMNTLLLRVLTHSDALVACLCPDLAGNSYLGKSSWDHVIGSILSPILTRAIICGTRSG